MILENPKLLGMWYDQSVSFFDDEQIIDPERMIEFAARNCYQSFSVVDETSHKRLIAKLDKSGHKTPKEFARILIKFRTDRGVLAELTRHRHCGYCVESTRYVNSAKNGSCAFIIPVFVNSNCAGSYEIATSFAHVDRILKDIHDKNGFDNATMAWIEACALSEYSYMKMGKKIDDGGLGLVPQESRSSLNMSTKTDIMFYTTFRQMELMSDLRMDSAAHPEIQRAFLSFMGFAMNKFPNSFVDFEEKYNERKKHFDSKGWKTLDIQIEDFNYPK